MASRLMPKDSLIAAIGVSKTFRVGGDRVQALTDVSLPVGRGETMAIVGESGSGKTTLGRIFLGVESPDAGEVRLADETLAPPLRGAARRRLQIVQQNPLSTLNPRRTVGQSVGLPIHVHRLASRVAARGRVAHLLELVGLPPDAIDRYPATLSGGQRQRAALARALAAEPEVIVLDEPTSALDVSMQARVLTLLADLRARFQLTYIFITHDLAVVRNFAPRTAVLYRGRLVEVGATPSLFRRPRHRYTTMLLSAIPVVSEEEEAVKPRWPEAPAVSGLERRSEGCPFAPRCPYALEVCWRQMPALERYAADHEAACHNPESLQA
jgi:peptide/nickel transport system ATP-binding protein/oligopeptide transport system ATP-binding protein